MKSSLEQQDVTPRKAESFMMPEPYLQRLKMDKMIERGFLYLAGFGLGYVCIHIACWVINGSPMEGM